MEEVDIASGWRFSHQPAPMTTVDERLYSAAHANSGSGFNGHTAFATKVDSPLSYVLLFREVCGVALGLAGGASR